MNSHLQGIEGELMFMLDNQFSIDHESLDRKSAQQRHDLREITSQRLSRFRTQIDVVAPFEGEAAKTVPFGLVLPGSALHR
jgi:hypothetical protein